MRGRQSRREFIKAGGTALAATAGLGGAWTTGRTARAEPAADWNRGDLAHLIPAVSHERILVKASFSSARTAPPRLRVGEAVFPGTATDQEGRFWQFDAPGLAAGTTHTLQIEDASGGALCDPWPLRTFPAPDAAPEHVRILAYTCAGGNEQPKLPDGTPLILPLEARQRLFARALSFAPDAVIGNGDQVYWDQVTGLNHPKLGPLVKQFYDVVGHFDRSQPIWGTANETLLKRVVDAQIAQLYGVRFRSVPTYLMQDDHDYFENDVATGEFISFPPEPFSLRLARATQRLYFPEYLPDANRPAGLPGASADDRAPGLSESFGTLRYGRLLEMLLYDCRRYLTLKGPTATFVPPEAEAWLAGRTADTGVQHVIHVPSTPFGWSAGKWGEWYPDVLGPDAALTTAIPKPYWQPGWFSQHQRILGMLHAQARRPAVIVSGDLHALGSGVIRHSGGLDFTDNAVHTVLAGPIGTAGPGWPSAFRGTPAQTPDGLEVEERLAPLEKNGFTLIDMTPNEIAFRQFAWRPPDPLDAIDTLEPLVNFSVSRPA